MKRNFLNTILIITLTFFSFIGILSFQKEIKINTVPGNLLDVLENKEYGNLISVKDLNEQMTSPDLKIIFIKSQKLPDVFIPNTRIVNLVDIELSKNSTRYIVDEKQFEEVLSNIGVNNDDTLILYDIDNSPYVARLYWTLKVYGHDYVKILNGGLNHWLKANLKTVNYPLKPEKSDYLSTDINKKMIGTINDIKDAIVSDDEVILDVRSKSSYDKGHIPTAINIPYNVTLDDNGLFKSPEELKAIYYEKGITEDKSIIYIYCTYGRQSAFTYFVLSEILDYNNVIIYDGSYSEYLQLTV